MKNSTACKMVFDKTPYDNVIMFPGIGYRLENDYEAGYGYDRVSEFDAAYDTGAGCDVEAVYDAGGALDTGAVHDPDTGIINILFDDLLMSRLSDILSPIICAACFVYIICQVFNWLMYV